MLSVYVYTRFDIGTKLYDTSDISQVYNFLFPSWEAPSSRGQTIQRSKGSLSIISLRSYRHSTISSSISQEYLHVCCCFWNKRSKMKFIFWTYNFVLIYNHALQKYELNESKAFYNAYTDLEISMTNGEVDLTFEIKK